MFYDSGCAMGGMRGLYGLFWPTMVVAFGKRSPNPALRHRWPRACVFQPIVDAVSG